MWPKNCLLIALLPMLLLSACGTPPVASPPVAVQPARVPPLPQAARQPPMPSICSPTCLEGLTRERGSWQQLLTQPEPLASPASAPTKP